MTMCRALIKFPRRKAVARVSVVVGEARHPLSPDDFLCLVRHVNELDWIRRTRRGWTADSLAGPRCWGMGKQQLRSVGIILAPVLGAHSLDLPPSLLPSFHVLSPFWSVVHPTEPIAAAADCARAAKITGTRDQGGGRRGGLTTSEKRRKEKIRNTLAPLKSCQCHVLRPAGLRLGTFTPGVLQ